MKVCRYFVFALYKKYFIWYNALNNAVVRNVVQKMKWLSSINFPVNEKSLVDREFGSSYPYRVIKNLGMERIDFEKVTVLHGGNGSGKSTVLNLIAHKAGLKRASTFYKSETFLRYADWCDLGITEEIPPASAIITSDDVFERELDIRSMNCGTANRREELKKEFLEAKYSNFQMKSLADFERIKEVAESQRKTKTKFVNDRVAKELRERSNGETALDYILGKLEENALYILDEPENSLTPTKQAELKKYLEESVLYFGCQLVISTHSPFLSAIDGAKIYDFNERPAAEKAWDELESVKAYKELFNKNRLTDRI